MGEAIGVERFLIDVPAELISQCRVIPAYKSNKTDKEIMVEFTDRLGEQRALLACGAK